MSTPVAVECGFCAMEAYGEVFETIGTGGLQPMDLPLVLQSVQLALGAGAVSGGACHGIAAPVDPNTMVHVEIWAGTTPPTTITTLPVAGMAWPGEDLVLSLDDVPVTMSTPTTDGAANFNLMFNTLTLGDSTTPAPTIDESHRYIRVVVVLGNGGSSTSCTPVTNAPTGFPLRDDDGVVQIQRSFLSASGMGWLWNEGVGVHGDWGIRLSIMSLPRDDAGPADAARTDAGSSSSDAATPLDAAPSRDGGHDAALVASGGGATCSCFVGARGASVPALLTFAMILLALQSRKVTRPKRAGTWKSPSSGADQPSPH